MKQQDLFEGRKLRDRGMKRAVDHADRVTLSWSDMAYRSLLRYVWLSAWDFRWQTCELAMWARIEGLPSPPDGRAWGSVVARAARAGIIVKKGYGPCTDPRQHACPTTLWGKP